MKIGNPLDLFRTGAPAGRTGASDTEKAKAHAPASAPAANGHSATVKLSGGLATLGATADSDGAFDAKRVAQLQGAIANGTFRVDSGVVADKVISSNLEALTRSKA